VWQQARLVQQQAGCGHQQRQASVNKLLHPALNV
jgi:hypothetical protein